MNLYDDARIKNIIRPQKAKIGKEFDEWITVDSDLWQKKCLVQIRRYQAIECNDGFSMDTSDGCWKHVEVFPFIDDFYDEKQGELRQWAVGGACFSTYEGGEVELDFCWIHPFFRNEGLLRRNWETFQDKFGHFFVSHPRTKAMQGFLDSVGYVDP